MGKWEFLKGKYPKLAPDSDYQEKVRQVQESDYYEVDGAGGPRLREVSDVDLCNWYNNKRRLKDQLEAELKVLELEVQAATQLFVERFESQDVQKIKFQDGTTLSVNPEPYPYVQDQQKLLTWVRQQGLESLLTLNYQTLASLTKERLLEGKPLPEGVDVFLKSKLTRRGGNDPGGPDGL
jgi:hypothetical protein